MGTVSYVSGKLWVLFYIILSFTGGWAHYEKEPTCEYLTFFSILMWRVVVLRKGPQRLSLNGAG